MWACNNDLGSGTTTTKSCGDLPRRTASRRRNELHAMIIQVWEVFVLCTAMVAPKRSHEGELGWDAYKATILTLNIHMGGWDDKGS
ncbi:hypothetical protein TIFTF001_014066 [Ficus carica]|uniref:Uncharacterized protein n=1 Tax=Ficus carica TaxID=3494 RepID=A0AA88A361_FICCA|nr:hypothetical protein TIFTF001_014066 [Ficus carica]